MKSLSIRTSIGTAILILGSLFFLIRGFHDESLALHGRDFKPVYAGARCLLEHCNPYDSAQIRQAYAEAGGDLTDPAPFVPFNANYPPSSLFWVMPFALLSWGPALFLWLATSSALFLLAAFLMASLCIPKSPGISLGLLGVFVASSTMLIMVAQPAEPAIGLCVIAAWCLIKNKFPLAGIVCFALSLTLKPQIGALVWLYFFLIGGVARRRALQILMTTVVFCVPGILWASLMPQSAHWVHELSTNLAGIAAHGNMSDPGPANADAPQISNLQAVISVLRDDRVFYNRVAYGTVGILLLIWGYVAARAKPSLRKNLLGIAAIACLCLLPVYHREYDTRLLLLTFPATALLLAEGGITKLLALLASLATVICTNHVYPRFAARHLAHSATLSPIKTILLLRPIPLVLLCCGLFYLVCFVRTLKPNRT